MYTYQKSVWFQLNYIFLGWKEKESAWFNVIFTQNLPISPTFTAINNKI